MKKLLSVFLFSLLASTGFAIGTYSVGDELFVHAGSGLVLRKTPDPKGQRVDALSYGESLVVQKTDYKKFPHSVEEFKGFTIKGYWVKVKTTGGKEGYVFDGYLSKSRPVVTIIDDANTGNSLAEFYLLSNSPKKGTRVDLPKSDTRYERYKQLFKNGSEAEIDSGEGGSSQKITFQKGITMEEAYLIGKMLWLKDMKVKPKYSRGMLTVTSEDELYQIEINSKIGVTILNMQHAD